MLRVQRGSYALRLLWRGGFSTSTISESIVASVLFERLPVVVPKIEPAVYAFQEFSFRWRQQYRREYPDEVLGKADSRSIVYVVIPNNENRASVKVKYLQGYQGYPLREKLHLECLASQCKGTQWQEKCIPFARGKGEYQIDYVPGPRITEADKTNDRRSLQRALDRRLYLLLYGKAYGTSSNTSVWHFPEKVYENEETLRKCAESALENVIGDLGHTYFVGNAPMGHISLKSGESESGSSHFKRYFFKSQVIATSKYNIQNSEDHVWVTKDELLEYFPEHVPFLSKMIIS